MDALASPADFNLLVFDRMVLHSLLTRELLVAPSLVTRTVRRFTTWLPTFAAVALALLLIVIM